MRKRGASRPSGDHAAPRRPSRSAVFLRIALGVFTVALLAAGKSGPAPSNSVLSVGSFAYPTVVVRPPVDTGQESDARAQPIAEVTREAALEDEAPAMGADGPPAADDASPAPVGPDATLRPARPPAAPLEVAVALPAPPSTPQVQVPAQSAAPSPSTPPPAPTIPPASPFAQPATTLSAMEQLVFSGHNAERTGAGVPALRLDAALVSVARARASDMATRGYFSHTSPNGETAFALMAAAGASYQAAAENIAFNTYPDAQAASVALSSFLGSAPHRANILDRRFTRVGVGAAAATNGTKYFVVVFAGP